MINVVADLVKINASVDTIPRNQVAAISVAQKPQFENKPRQVILRKIREYVASLPRSACVMMPPKIKLPVTFCYGDNI
jgi:hypothetical protein